MRGTTLEKAFIFKVEIEIAKNIKVIFLQIQLYVEMDKHTPSSQDRQLLTLYTISE